MFERYSDRSRRIIFLSRKVAGQRGAAEIGVEDLLEALVAEDQGEFALHFLRETPSGAATPVMPKHPAFFTAETAAEIRRGLAPFLAARGNPLPTSVDMPIDNAMKAVLEHAQTLSEEGHEPTPPTHLHYGRLEPLHLLAAVLANEESEFAHLLQRAGVAQDAVMDRLRRGDSV